MQVSSGTLYLGLSEGFLEVTKGGKSKKGDG
jgi:hypothetical protein